MKDQIPTTRNRSLFWFHPPAPVAATVATLIGVTAVLALACSDETLPVSSKPPADALPISGMYEVSGVTVDLTSRDEREISGRVILNREGATYTATFDLDTLFPTEHGRLEADVIGSGSGSIEGRTLTGSAETQVIVSTVPGIDPAFAFVPRTTTRRIVSESVTTVGGDGTVQVDIDSQPAEGEDYSPTHTTLRGTRIGEAAD
jgi:hypothetical protein